MKNLTHIALTGGRIGGQHGVYDEGKTDVDQGVCSPVPAGGESERENQNLG
jgi:hypothetical protein